MTSWALVTGASSGIGRSIVFRLAKEHYRLVLVSRNEEALKSLAEELKHKSGIQTLVIAEDLSKSEACGRIAARLKSENIAVDILVNNAGFGIHGRFLETSLEQEIAMVQLQITSMLSLTKLLLPAMIEKKRGKILNVASVYAYAPVPSQSVYGACKAFMLSFSESLRAEVEPFGINVTTVCPGVTQTEFRRRAGIREKKAGAGMTPEEVAEFSYKALMRGKSIAVPGVINRIFVTAAKCLPSSTLPKLMKTINSMRGLS